MLLRYDDETKEWLCIKQYIKDIEINTSTYLYGEEHPLGFEVIDDAIIYFHNLVKEKNSNNFKIKQIKEKWGNFVVYSDAYNKEGEKELKELFYKVLKKYPKINNFFDVFEYDEKIIKKTKDYDEMKFFLDNIH